MGQSTEVEVIRPESQAIETATEIGQLLKIAVEKQVPVETLERIQAMYERMEDRNAAKAFNVALAAFQNECASIKRTKEAKITPNSGTGFKYKYAELDDIAKATRPLLTKHGLSYTWDSSMDGTAIVCTCKVSHVAGHFQTATFRCPTETSAGMSAQQRHASALTFARRQSLIQALGLTMTDQDTDGASMERITEQQALTIEDWIKDSGADRGKFLNSLGVGAVGEIPAKEFKRAVNSLKAAKLDKMEKKGGVS